MPAIALKGAFACHVMFIFPMFIDTYSLHVDKIEKFRHVLAICRWNRHTETLRRKNRKISTCHQQTSIS
ncbi:hypothetical protein EAE90_06680 [Photorhabdus caribbeanensis]|nr:hypothetical protein [Photorhabdus caribbeanensis]